MTPDRLANAKLVLRMGLEVDAQVEFVTHHTIDL